MYNRLFRFQTVVFLLGVFVAISTQLLAQNGNMQHITHNQIGKTVYKLKKEYEQYIGNNDTLNAILSLNELGGIHSQQAQYTNASNYFWEALLLADAINDSVAIAQINESIGWLYSFYLRKDEAFEYYNSTISIRKQLVKAGKTPLKEMVSSYYNMVILHREIGELDLCKAYLDSCYQIMYSVDQDNEISNYIMAEQALYNISRGQIEMGIDFLNRVIPWFEENAPSYLIVIYTHMGNAYYKLKMYEKSIDFFHNALEYSKTYGNHINHVPIIYGQLATLYNETGDCGKAFASLTNSKKTNEELFDSRSYNNKSLLEITDNFKKEKLLQKELLQNQRLAQLENEAKFRLYNNIILLGAVLFLFIFGFIMLRFIKVKHRTEKELARKNNELEHKKNLELLELKNKELAASALQLVEKDKLLKELKSNLFNKKKNIELSELKSIFRKITLNSNNYWKEFELRFIEINEEFYKDLMARYPMLTPADLKLCALIKLNFTSKEMSNLLAISVESVHSLRYRLRKKMGLTRADNLFEHLYAIGIENG